MENPVVVQLRPGQFLSPTPQLQNRDLSLPDQTFRACFQADWRIQESRWNCIEARMDVMDELLQFEAQLQSMATGGKRS